ncbi:hypothetical protein BAE44_0004499 [Dichanthelium oligosanthes]|uniref:Thioredoxin-like protein AAED1, chloroplastic n=1 Tax=Dichanthelium oligosanthes TaxID=888268 RepID=A0A1E5WAR8_9POAL|nr:hypothetical protein BAE44_0004499 [Dichanthelium oligosanthes]
MATAISLPRGPLITPRACNPGRLVHVSTARTSRQRGGRRVGRRALNVSTAAVDSSGLAPIAAGTPAWDALGGVSVLAAGTGDAVPLTDLWDPTEGVAVVALLRHFGCFCCWELASVLKDSMAKFDSAGAKLIAIGVGTPDKARILADRLPFPVDSLYADPERKAYDVLGLYHGLGRTLFSPASAKIYSRLDYIKKVTKNYTLEGTPSDLTGVLQQDSSSITRGHTSRVPPSAIASVPPQRSLPPLGALQPRTSTASPVPPMAASLVPRVSLPPPVRPTAASSRGPDLVSGLRCRRGHRRLRRSPSPVGANAASSSSVPSSSPDPGSGIGEALGGVEIYSAATGEPVLFRDLWDQNEGMAVVALLRHFGCPCCWELASVLRDTKERFDAAGVKLIAVGVGTPAKARILAERLPFPLEYLYADPERKVYDLLGLYFGIGRTFFNPASEAVKNYTIEATPDDRAGVLQQGGMFVFKGKELLYARKDEGTGDHAPLDDVLNICCKVPVA